MVFGKIIDTMGICISLSRVGDIVVCSSCHKHCEAFKSSVGPPQCRHQYCLDCMKSLPNMALRHDCKYCIELFHDISTIVDKLMKYAAARAVIGAMVGPDIEKFLVEKYNIAIKPLDYKRLVLNKHHVKAEVAKYTTLELRTTAMCNKLCRVDKSPEQYIDTAKCYVKISGHNVTTINADLTA